MGKRAFGLLLVILFLFCGVSIAGDCEYCPTGTGCLAEFTRGDVNCDGSVNWTDVTIIGNCMFGSYTYCGGRLDAMDINDDGHLYPADITQLCNYFTQSGPAPSEPFATAPGLDCTADGLDECVSKPESADNYYMSGLPTGTAGSSSTSFFRNFDDKDCSNGTNMMEYKFENDRCNNYNPTIESVSAHYDVSSTGDDVGVTHARLESGVQKVYIDTVTFSMDINYAPSTCEEAPGSFKFFMGDSSTYDTGTYLTIWFGNVPVYIDFKDVFGNQELEYTFEVDEYGLDWTKVTQTYSASDVDITDDVIAALEDAELTDCGDDCDTMYKWNAVGYNEVLAIYEWDPYASENDDPLEDEYQSLSFYCKLKYEWCGD